MYVCLSVMFRNIARSNFLVLCCVVLCCVVDSIGVGRAATVAARGTRAGE